MLERIGVPAAAVWWVAIASAAMFGLTLLAIPWLVIRIPADYFQNEQRTAADSPLPSLWLRWIWLVVKNLLGLGFLFFEDYHLGQVFDHATPRTVTGGGDGGLGAGVTTRPGFAGA